MGEPDDRSDVDALNQVAQEIAYRHVIENTESDPNLPRPGGCSTLWRFMDMTQLLSLLERESLYFPRSDEFKDPYEGSLPQKNLEKLMRSFDIEDILEDFDEISADTIEPLMKHTFVKVQEFMKEGVFLNCWHQNPKQSAAMWEQYATKDAGLAIKTTYNNLISSFGDPSDLIYGSVTYRNYEIETIPEGVVKPFFYKRISFDHENEFRVATVDSNNISIGEGVGDEPKGRYIEVDLEVLLDQIYVTPDAEPWLKHLVDDVIDTYELDISVVQSDLYNDSIQ
ncbi:hypothetical protein ACLI4Z_04320 [Natrialbaceae archaeon A-arb3/5]